MGLGTNHASLAQIGPESAAALALDPVDHSHDPDRLADWSDFHREVEALPEEEREAFDLLFYQGLTQAAAAGLLDVSERTIKRRWQSARMRLVQTLGARMPGHRTSS
jgi:RNA polymerase sigma factor (sigma-70 family)